MKILMVCLGNICRSPMAEGILRHQAQLRGLQIETDSAGTGNYHIGEAPDRRAQAAMLRKGIQIHDLRARQLHPSDFDRFDAIYTMDRSNYNNTLALARTEAHRKKVKPILDELFPGEHREVPDPYFGGDSGFDAVYQMLHDACERILDQLHA